MSADLKITLRKCACGGDAYLAIIEHGSVTVAVAVSGDELRSYQLVRVKAFEQYHHRLPRLSRGQWRALIGAEL